MLKIMGVCNLKKVFLVLPIILALGVLTAFAAFPTNPYDFLQLGNATSETGHNAVGFGPEEPTTHGGNWGGIATTSDPLSDKLVKVVWAGNEPDHFAERGAEFTMRVPQKCGGCYMCDWYKTVAKSLKLRVLDGVANDDFIVLWKDPTNNWQLLYVYVSDPSTAEVWKDVTVDLSTIPVFMRNRGKELTFKVVATGNAWQYFSTYGQVALDYVSLEN